GDPGLRPLDDPDHQVTHLREPVGEHPCGGGLSHPVLAGHHCEASIAYQVLDAPEKLIEPGGGEEGVYGDVLREGIPLEAVEGERLFRVHSEVPFSSLGGLGM